MFANKGCDNDKGLKGFMFMNMGEKRSLESGL